MDNEEIKVIKNILDKNINSKITFMLNSGHSYLSSTFLITARNGDDIVIATTVDDKGKSDKVVVFHVSSIHHVYFENLKEKDIVGFVTKASK
jgi:hypothetical protein